MSSTAPADGYKINSTPQATSQSAGAGATSVKRRKKDNSRPRKRSKPDSTATGNDDSFMEIIGDFSQLGDDPQDTSSRDDFDDAGLGDDLRFDGAENLASPEAGPSRLPMTPAASSFTPLPRSVLSAFGKRPAFSPERSASPVRTEEADRRETDLQAPSGQSNGMTSADATVSEHFDPPGLFFTSVETAIKAQTAAVSLEKSHLGNDTKEDANGAPATGLLLPDNIILDGLPSADGEGRDGDAGKANLSMEGLHFVDDNITRGVQRYFVPEQTEEETFLATADQSKICQNCKKPGHRSKECPHIICTVCGAMDEHERRDCPHGIVCFGCGQRGHRQSGCPNPISRFSKKRGCDRCGSRDHPEGACPTVWRIYRYFSSEERSESQDKKRKATEWAKEALGDVGAEMFCYNCANPGHLGDDCPRPRASAAKLFNPTAFSRAMASRGPYYNDREQTRSTATPTHTRFDDDDNLPDVAPAFAGSNAGRKTREKARKVMMDRETRAASDDEEDWFSNHRSPASTPNGRGRGLGIRGRGGKMAGTPRNRPWDSDSRPTQGRNDPARGMPFGHSHLMASAPASARGNRLSFQDIASGTGGSDSPTASKGKGKKGGNLARNLLERAIKGSQRGQQSPADSKKSTKPSKTSQPKKTDKSNKSSKSPAASWGSRGNAASPAPSQAEPPKRRRKKNRDDEADLESTWWSSGKAGGNVSDWGKDMPSPSTGPKGKKAAVKGNKGQQYMGGY